MRFSLRRVHSGVAGSPEVVAGRVVTRIRQPLQNGAIIISSVLAWMLGSGATSAVQAQAPSNLLESAVTAFDLGRFTEARGLLERVVEVDNKQAEAHHLLARIYLEVEPRDLTRSRQANNRALQLEPENVEYLSLRLTRLHFFPSSFLPTVGTGRRQDLAEEILELDPRNEVAHFVLGEIHLEDYIDARASVNISDVSRLRVRPPREALYSAAYLLNPALDPGLESGLEFQLPRQYGATDVPHVTRDRDARKRYRYAVEHLQVALEENPLRRATYRSLLRASILEGDLELAGDVVNTMVARLPDESDAWLYSGLVSFRSNRVAEADRAFARALELMGDSLSGEYLDTSRLAPPNSGAESPADPSDFWIGKDPMLLTPQNERKLEHLSRMAYADIRFGNMFPDRRGWDTEPGDVVVRYGVPLGEAQTSTRFDKYLVLHYGNFFFKFMDLAKAGALTFYTPKTGSGRPNLDEVQRAFEEDFTLVSRRLFRELPDRFVYDRHGTRQPIPYLVSVLKGQGGDLDFYVTLAVPNTAHKDLGTVRSGAWLLDDQGAIVAGPGRDPYVGLEIDREDVTYQVLTQRLTAPPGNYRIAVEYEDATRDHAGFHRRPLTVQSRFEASPGMSDLVLAYSVEEGGQGVGFRRGRYSIEPAPWGVFERGQPIYVFFETYNKDATGMSPKPYRIQASMSPYDGKGDVREAAEKVFDRDDWQRVSVSYSAEARSPEEAQYLILDTMETAPGTYVVGLRLIDETSRAETFAGRAVILE